MKLPCGARPAGSFTRSRHLIAANHKSECAVFGLQTKSSSNNSRLPVKWNSQNLNTLTSSLPIQSGGQVCPSNANPTNIKGVVGKSVSANFHIRTTSPSAIRIFLETFAFELRGECCFSFGRFGLLSVCRIDVARAH